MRIEPYIEYLHTKYESLYDLSAIPHSVAA